MLRNRSEKHPSADSVRASDRTEGQVVSGTWKAEGELKSSMATSRSSNVSVTVKRQNDMLCQYFSFDASFSSRSISNCAIFLQTAYAMAMVRLLIGQGPQNISGGRKPVADEGVPAYRHTHHGTTRRRRFVPDNLSYISNTNSSTQKVVLDQSSSV